MPTTPDGMFLQQQNSYSLDDILANIATGQLDEGGNAMFYDLKGNSQWNPLFGLPAGLTFGTDGPRYQGQDIRSGALRQELERMLGADGYTANLYTGGPRQDDHRLLTQGSNNQQLSDFHFSSRGSTFSKYAVPLIHAAIAAMGAATLGPALGLTGEAAAAGASTGAGEAGAYSLGNASLAAPAAETGAYGLGNAALGNTGTVGFGAGGTGAGLSVPAGTWGGIGAAGSTAGIGALSSLPADLSLGGASGTTSTGQGLYGGAAGSSGGSGAGLAATPGAGLQLSGTGATGGALGTGSVSNGALNMDTLRRINQARNLVNQVSGMVGGPPSAGGGGGAPGIALGDYEAPQGKMYRAPDAYTGSREGASSAVNFDDAAQAAVFGYGDTPEYWVPRMASGGAVKPNCFITEAVMAATGEGDDAKELEVLRAFRDEFLLQDPEYAELVAEYDAIAPLVVEALNKREDAKEIYEFLADEFIEPAVEAILEDELDEALRLYAAMISFVQPLVDDEAMSVPEQAAVEQLGADAAAVAGEVNV